MFSDGVRTPSIPKPLGVPKWPKLSMLAPLGEDVLPAWLKFWTIGVLAIVLLPVLPVVG